MPKKLPRIAEVRAWIQKDTLPGGPSFPPRNSVEAEAATSGDVHGLGRWIDGVSPWPPISNPMSVYDQYSGPRSTWGIGVHSLIVCEVVAEDGTYGCGITSGGEAGCWIIERHLSRFVEGQDPRDIELMWDQMWRASMPYGRKGIAVHALSAIDLALWDLLGKLQGEPVYNLLGGRVSFSATRVSFAFSSLTRVFLVFWCPRPKRKCPCTAPLPAQTWPKSLALLGLSTR